MLPQLRIPLSGQFRRGAGKLIPVQRRAHAAARKLRHHLTAAGSRI